MCTGHSGISPALSKTVIIPEGDEGAIWRGWDSGFCLLEGLLGNQDSCSVAGRRPSQRTPRWTAAIHRKPSSPAVLGTTCLRSRGPRMVQGVPGLSSLQEASRGGSSPPLPAPGGSRRPSLGGWPPPSHLCLHPQAAVSSTCPCTRGCLLRSAAALWDVGTALSQLGCVLPSS